MVKFSVDTSVDRLALAEVKSKRRNGPNKEAMNVVPAGKSALRKRKTVDQTDHAPITEPSIFSSGIKRRKQVDTSHQHTPPATRSLGAARVAAAEGLSKWRQLSGTVEPLAPASVEAGQYSKGSAESKKPNAPVKFEQLGLSESLCTICTELGMKSATPVQQACIPAILEGKNVVGLAQTGSGKTAAFALPILQRLVEDPFGVFALILTPTRELAIQIADQFRALGSGSRLRVCVVIGGVGMTAQAQRVSGRPHVVIATPGRLRDHLQSDPAMASVFGNIRFLVLDEADRLLDSGFESEISAVLRVAPERRQTLLFSATITTNLRALATLGMGADVFRYEAYSGFQVVASLLHRYIFIPSRVKAVYLFHLLSSLEAMEVQSVIVFASTCRSCHLLSLLLAEVGLSSAALHSLQSQGRRLSALARFRTAQVSILVATDVASRGLDIPQVDLVINYDIPRFTRDYVHRVGRTARAGREGMAISLVSEYDVGLVQAIEKLTGVTLEEYPLEEEEVLKGITKVFKARRAALLKMVESGFDELAKERKEANMKSRKGTSGSSKP